MAIARMVDIELQFNSIVISLSSALPEKREILTMYIDQTKIAYAGEGPTGAAVHLSVCHVQIDDMRYRAKPKFAVVLAPSDSGLNRSFYFCIPSSELFSDPIKVMCNHAMLMILCIYIFEMPMYR